MADKPTFPKSTEPRVQPGYEIGGERRGQQYVGLTAREREVLGMLEAGLKQTQIAQQMGLTRARVSAIVKQIRSKAELIRSTPDE